MGRVNLEATDMNGAPTIEKISATELLERLDPDQIRERLAALEGEREGLRVLLRSILARRRAALRLSGWQERRSTA